MAAERGDTAPDDDHDADAPPPPRDAPPVLPYASPGILKLATIRRMPSFEAGLAAAKLEAAGVRCFIADQNISVIHPMVFTDVRLQVPEADVERAEQILAERSTLADGDEESEPGTSRVDRGHGTDDDDDYVDEPYRCPQCRRKQVDLMPLSPPMRNTRFGCLLVLFLPLVVGVASWMLPAGPGAPAGVNEYPPGLVLGWVAVLAVLSVIVLTAKRSKRCRQCGHVWSETPPTAR